MKLVGFFKTLFGLMPQKTNIPLVNTYAFCYLAVANKWLNTTTNCPHGNISQ